MILRRRSMEEGVSGEASTLLNGLVSYWKLDESSGGAIDSQGSNNGTVVGATQGVAGKIGTAYSFDGNDDYVSYGTSSVLKPNTGDMSWSIWLNPDIDNGGDAFLRDRLLGATNSGKYGYAIGGGGNTNPGAINIFLETSGGYKSYVKLGAYTSSEGWFQLIVTWTNSTDSLNLYKNNEEIIMTKNNDDVLTGENITNNEELILGDSPSHTLSRNYNGKIDDVKIWNRELTLSEIEEDYTNGLNGTALL